VREQQRGSLSLFLSFLASFAIKKAEREIERGELIGKGPSLSLIVRGVRGGEI
jgi:hypothetical protein